MKLEHLAVLIVSLMLSAMARAQPETVILDEPGFPAADSAASVSVVKQAIPGAQPASARELKERLNAANLLVLPYGSAFPEEVWADIQSFLERGGNLLVLGGRPFTRAAYRDGANWRLRDYSVRYTRPLRIDQYQETPGADGLEFESNPDIPLAIPEFAWKRAFSPIVHLSAVDLYNRGGSAGSIDSNLDALAWGTKDGRRMAAPLIQIDHFRNGFDGGRWILVDAELSPDFYASADAREIISRLAAQAARGAEEFTVRPVLPLYLPGETVELEITLNPAAGKKAVELEVLPDRSERAPKSPSRPIRVELSRGPQTLVEVGKYDRGLHFVEAKLLDGDKTRVIYHSGFWIRDLDYLRSGPKLGVNENYFELEGKPLAVIGTTYMSSEVERLYFERPNVYVWDRDLGQIHDAGLNMIRTGWWTGWDKFSDENGVPYERTLRTLEAYLMTARKYGLPVQFNFFAFLPEVLGGVNPYLDPEAVRKQKTLVAAVAGRFEDVPFLAYDLINEPSFSRHLWTMRPNGDAIEIQKWNEWLDKHYAKRADLAAAWNVPITSVQGSIALPEEMDFEPRGMYSGRNSLKIYDYEMFAQESFAEWVKTLRDAIRGTGSKQLITVGQDEGGFEDRLSPAFFGQYVDFTTNHSWWQNDSILWDSLVAKQPAKAMLIQETGLQRELNLDETSRRTPESEAALFERKVAMSFVGGSGAIEWLWTTNSYMTEGNETPIGALRADGTEKPEATVLRNFAKFAAQLGPHLRNPEPAQVAVIASQAAQYSAIRSFQIEAQRTAVRAVGYHARFTPYLIYENQIDRMGNPKLAVLPSAQALTENAWQQLLKYVEGGGDLLITGPVERDEHGQRVNRAGNFIPGAQTLPLTFHAASSGDPSKAGKVLVFDQDAQSWLEYLHFGSHGPESRDVEYGRGHILWTAYPAELASEGEAATRDYIATAEGGAKLSHLFALSGELSPGILVYPISLEDSVLYIFSSDSQRDEPINLEDKTTGARLTFTLPSERAALALIGKKQRAVIAKYGF